MVLSIPLVFSKLHEATYQVTNYNIYQAILRSMSQIPVNYRKRVIFYTFSKNQYQAQLCPKCSIDEFQTHMHLLSFQDNWATLHSLHVCTLAVKMALILNFLNSMEIQEILMTPVTKHYNVLYSYLTFNHLILHCLIFKGVGKSSDIKKLCI